MSLAGVGCELTLPTQDLRPCREIERSIIKKLRKETWTPFIKGIKEFKLINDGDRIAVAVSGGKDSLLMAKMLQELHRHGMKNFSLEFIAMDPGYHPHIRKLLEDNCAHLEIPVHIFDVKIFDVVDRISADYPCYMCARMRRGALYAKAQELGCNKLALGHHYDDVVETIMLNVLCGGQYMTMMPKLKAKNFENMELIRPMTYIREEGIIRFADTNGISPLNCGCMVAATKTAGKRKEIKELIKSLGTSFADVEKCIFNSARNVHMDAILGWKTGDDRHDFLDKYDE